LIEAQIKIKKKQKKIVVRSIKSETNKEEINNYNKRDLDKKLKSTNDINKDNEKKFDSNAKYNKKKINFSDDLFSLKSEKK